MALISFQDWLQKESSAATRWRAEAARGLKPQRADFMSRSTPSPFEMEQHTKKKKKSKKKD